MHLLIKHFKHLNTANLSIKLVLIALCLSSFSTACGKRKPPLPPSERVTQKVELSGFQRGSQVRLSWSMPAKNAKAGSLLNIKRVDIYRLAEILTTSQTLDEEDFTSRSTVIASVQLNENDFARKTLSYLDTLDFAGQSVRLRYAIRFVNSEGQRAAFSNFLLVEPTAKVANNPTNLNLLSYQDFVKLVWKSPETNIDTSKPANIIGFNIYRALPKDETAKLLNETPVQPSEYNDTTFVFGTSYKYFVRTVSLGANAQAIESVESTIIEITPKDTFAPSFPTAITLAASPTSISIFFASNPETDVVGYKIYRSVDEKNWSLLNEKLIETTTFQDNSVESGKTYFYYIVAVDKFRNESEKSEIVKEIVP
jgi:hypothetical protein